MVEIHLSFFSILYFFHFIFILHGLVSANCRCEVIFSLHAIRNGFRCVPADGVMVEDVLAVTGGIRPQKYFLCLSHEQGCCGLFENAASY